MLDHIQRTRRIVAPLIQIQKMEGVVITIHQIQTRIKEKTTAHPNENPRVTIRKILPCAKKMERLSVFVFISCVFLIFFAMILPLWFY